MPTPKPLPNFQNPLFGKLSSVQEKYDAGEKTPQDPLPDPLHRDPIGGHFDQGNPYFNEPTGYGVSGSPSFSGSGSFVYPVFRETTPCVPGFYYITYQLATMEF